MKTLKIAALLLVFVFTSCKKDNQENTEETTEFEYVLMGNVVNGDGQELKLVIPSLYPNETSITKVENGKYLFTGKLNNIEKAGLSVVIGEQSMMMPKKVFLTKDTIVLDLEIGEQFNQTMILSDTVLKNKYNQYARKMNKRFWELNTAVIYADKVKSDSMRKNIYPGLRNKLINFLEEELNEKQYSAIRLDYLRRYVADDPVFDARDLSPSEISSMDDMLSQIDSTLVNTADYKVTQQHLYNLKNNAPITFKDHTLVNIDGNEVTLSSVIAKNKMTVLDFWWSGCAPCRKFNVDAKPHYNELKELGVEIIAINVDRQSELWKKSSTQDQIEWVNLFASQNSTIIPEYQIDRYPTTFIFDQNQKLVNAKFHTIEELLDIATAFSK